MTESVLLAVYGLVVKPRVLGIGYMEALPNILNRERKALYFRNLLYF